ncbi:MAG: hypothetical protein MHMPM18_004167, partial [Marteilia pararefringens]
SYYQGQSIAFCGGSIQCLTANLLTATELGFEALIACSVRDSFDIVTKFGPANATSDECLNTSLQLWSLRLSYSQQGVLEHKFKFIGLINHNLQFCRMVEFRRNKFTAVDSENSRNELLACTSSNRPLAKIFM